MVVVPPESDEIPINAKFDFWNQLSDDIQTECIERMDFKSRMRLRSTSKQDKLLVESAPKYQFDNVDVVLDPEYKLSVICKKSGLSEVKIVQKAGRNATTEAIMKIYHLSVQILKFSNTETFDFSLLIDDDVVSKFIADISNSTPFHFKNIVLDCPKFEIIDFFLKNCNSLESIKLGSCGYGIETDKMMELINLPSVINAKLVLMSYLNSSETPYQLIRKWLEKDDLELGKTLQFRVEVNSLINILAEKFEDRVVSKTDETLRLRTNDPAGNHIFIRNDCLGSFYSAVVIPSDQNESEIKNDKYFVAYIMGKCLERTMGLMDRDYEGIPLADWPNELEDYVPSPDVYDDLDLFDDGDLRGDFYDVNDFLY